MGATEESVKRAARVLTGFMTQNEALGFSRGDAVDPNSFMAAWQAQVGNAAALPQTYAAPKIDPTPPSSAAHLAQVTAHPAFAHSYPGTDFKMIEIAKLIAMQIWVDTDASDGVHGSGVQATPTEAEVLNTCLPPALASPVQTRWQQEGGRFVIYSMNNTFGVQGIIPSMNTGEIKIVTGANPNLMLVLEHAGRYVLSNGYHRAWMLLSRGVTMAPVVVRSVSTPRELAPAVGFFQPNLLMSARPPLVGDFQNPLLATTTEVRSTMRMIRISAEVLTVPRLL
jgi:hypothetical protein